MVIRSGPRHDPQIGIFDREAGRRLRKAGHGAIVAPRQQRRQARIGRVIAPLQPQVEAEGAPGPQHVVGVQRVDDDRTAGRTANIALVGRPAQHLKARDQVGVDIGPVARAIIAAPDGQRLFGPVDHHGHAPRPLNAANAGIERAAVARIAAQDVDHAGQQVRRRDALVALDLGTVLVPAGIIGVEYRVMAALGACLRDIAWGFVTVHLQGVGNKRRCLHLGRSARGCLPYRQHPVDETPVEAAARQQPVERPRPVHPPRHPRRALARHQRRVEAELYLGLLRKLRQRIAQRLGRNADADIGLLGVCARRRHEARQRRGRQQHRQTHVLVPRHTAPEPRISVLHVVPPCQEEKECYCASFSFTG